jgi:hypothetical protein
MLEYSSWTLRKVSSREERVRRYSLRYSSSDYLNSKVNEEGISEMVSDLMQL